MLKYLEPVTQDTTVKSSLSQRSVKNVKLAMIGHFTTKQISEAKNALWAHCSYNIIGKKQRKNDSNSRSVSETHISHIITTWGEPEKKDCLRTAYSSNK